MKIVTWNVNSVKARCDRLVAFLAREQPDVVCLQELKCTEDGFPLMEINGAGYECAVFGQKTYNGVAILSKQPASDVVKGIQDNVDDPQARMIAGTVNDIRVISVYVPNGKQVGSDKYDYKLNWMKRLHAFLEKEHNPTEKIVVCGDINVATDDKDVANPDKWAASVLCHENARAALRTIQGWGLEDVFRKHHPDGAVYSWWDYRMLGFPKGDGLRIDHILATEALARDCSEARVDRNERKGKLPSDHAPVIARFDL